MKKRSAWRAFDSLLILFLSIMFFSWALEDFLAIRNGEVYWLSVVLDIFWVGLGVISFFRGLKTFVFAFLLMSGHRIPAQISKKRARRKFRAPNSALVDDQP